MIDTHLKLDKQLRIPIFIQRIIADSKYDQDFKKNYITILEAYINDIFRIEHKGLWIFVKDGVLLADAYITEESAQLSDIQGCTMHQIGCEL